MSKRVEIKDLTNEQCIEHLKRLTNVNFINDKVIVSGNYLEVDVFPYRGAGGRKKDE